MPSLVGLPDELLVAIILQIEAHRDAVALACVNHRFLNLCELPLRRKYRRILIVDNATLANTARMLLQILKKPYLGNYVRLLQYDHYDGYGVGVGLSINQFQLSEIALFEEVIKEAEFPEHLGDRKPFNILFESTGDYARYGYNPFLKLWRLEIWAALFAVVSPKLISIACSNLGHYNSKLTWPDADGLQYENPAAGPRSFFGYFMNRVGELGSQSPFLQQVREVEFLADTDVSADERFYEYEDTYSALNIVRRLPALETIRFAGTTDENVSIRPPPRSANYTSITFHHSALSWTVLDTTIRSARLLRKLTLTLGGRSMSEGNFHPIVLDKLLYAMLEHRETLTYLDLDTEDSLIFEQHFEWEYGRWDWDDELEMSQSEKNIYENEWEEEFLASAIYDKDSTEVKVERPELSLRSLSHLKHLSLGVYSIYYLARGIGEDRISNDSLNIADRLPSSLESLQVYGYEHGVSHQQETEEMNLRLDEKISEFMRERTAKLPLLKSIKGLDETIPNGVSVEHPDEDRHLLWKRQIAEWTDYEY